MPIASFDETVILSIMKYSSSLQKIFDFWETISLKWGFTGMDALKFYQLSYRLCISGFSSIWCSKKHEWIPWIHKFDVWDKEWKLSLNMRVLVFIFIISSNSKLKYFWRALVDHLRETLNAIDLLFDLLSRAYFFCPSICSRWNNWFLNLNQQA